MMNILVLYSRFSAYVNASFSRYAQLYNVDIHIVRHSADRNSPFDLKKSSHLFFYNRDEVDFDMLKMIIEQNNVKVVICSGWRDKLYMKFAKWAFDKNLLTICIVDNQWMGTLKQRLLTLVSPLMLKTRFAKIWVPGVYQFEYARRLGFARYDIMLRFYTADTSLFLPKESVVVPNRFVYVGRLLEIKGIDVLYKTLLSLIPILEKNNWKFIVVGNGDKRSALEQMAAEHNCIEYYSFLQPEDLAMKTSEGGVFVLPSNYDAWGVVVHEYALLGSPMLLSEAVGSRPAFLIEGYNGRTFISGSAESLTQQCKRFINTEQEELNEMGRRSQMLASGYNLDIWAATLKSAVDDHFTGTRYAPLKRTKYQ